MESSVNYTKKSDAYEGVKPDTLFLHDEVGHWENPKMKFNYWLPKIKFNMKGSLYIFIGISGSGKSTFAHQLWLEEPDKYVIVNRDKVRELLFGFTEENVHEYYALPKLAKYEKQVTRYCDTLIHDGLNHGKTVIIDQTNLTAKYVQAFAFWNVPTMFKMFHIDPKLAIARDAKRRRSVGEVVIERQYAQFKSLEYAIKEKGILEDFYVKTIEMNPDNPKAFIFDIDGTLAHMDRNLRSPYDWDKVGLDTVDEPTATVFDALSLLGNDEDIQLILCTGRDEAALDETFTWLVQNNLHEYAEFHIRPKGDMRPDWVVKEEMWRKIAGDYNIVGMFDDRLQVVRRARALGLKVFNVEYGNF